MELLVMTSGLMKAIYAEEIPIQLLGNVQIVRASQVEPDAHGQWWADLSLSQGPVLGPFPLRSEALNAEREWLTENAIFADLEVIEGHSPQESEPDQFLGLHRECQTR